MIKLQSGTRTCYFPIDMHPPIHQTTDSSHKLEFGYSKQSLILYCHKVAFKTLKICTKLCVLLCEHNTYLSTYPESFMS